MPYISTGSDGSSRSISPPTVLEGNGPEPIAIVGMGCRWPGNVRDTKGLWELLRKKKSGYREFGDHRYPIDGYYHPNPDNLGTVATRGGFLLEEDPRLFDHAFFGMTTLEVETMDPSQRKLLEVVYEAFENAGESWDKVSGSRTGVFVGNFSNDHLFMQTRDPDYPRPYASTGSSTSILGNRVNYIFNLRGPSVTIDTACSSSMYALHLATSALRNGDCDAAIVAASNCIIDPAAQLMMTKLGVLSPSSTCHTFDASADGYARGEGFSALYLKRASDAVATGCPIRSLVRGTAINANGRTGGITHPSQQGQEAVIRQAYQNANLPLDDTTYFECHGTGTPVGDPVEVSAIGNVFSPYHSPDDPLLIGSIKTNLGHTESGSAIAGIMKVVLALEAGLIPPSIGVNKLNPHIDFQRSMVEVLREVSPWPAGKCRRASINSFGYGGANGHCIIDHVNNVLPGYTKPGLILHCGPSLSPSAASLTVDGQAIDRTAGKLAALKAPLVVKGNGPYPHLALAASTTKKAYATTRQYVLFPFSAHNETSLKLNIEALACTIDQHSLADVAYTLSAKRTRFMQRGFRIVDKNNVKTDLLAEGEASSSSSMPSKIAFVFTGQGAQWPEMGSRLLQYAVFQNTIQFLDSVLAQLPTPSKWKMEDILMGHCEEGRVNVPEVSQTVCTAVQVGLIDLLHSWNVTPSAVVGHSSGEIAATYAAGRISAAVAIVTAYFRGQAVSTNNAQGAMLAVGLGPEEVEPYLQGREASVKVAAINSPKSVTLSGDTGDITAVSQTMTKRGVFNRALQTGGNAYHSHHMPPLGEKYQASLSAGLNHVHKAGLAHPDLRYPSCNWVSSVMPDRDSNALDITASYWRANLESPVRFSEAVANLMIGGDQEINVLVEVGPHPALKSPLSQILVNIDHAATYVPTLKRKQDDQICMLQLAGNLFCHNTPVDLAAVNSVDHVENRCLSLVHGCMAIDLPPYQYAYGPIQYYESRLSREFRSRTIPHHALIGSKLLGTSKTHPQWRNILRMKDISWLGDHRLLPHAVFPAAGFTAMAVEVANRLYNELSEPLPITGFSLRNISIDAALRIPEDDQGIEVMLGAEPSASATAKAPGWINFSISSVARDSNAWTEHCTGSVKVEVAEPKAISRMSTRMDPRVSDNRAWYKKFKQMGLGYGDAFQGLMDIQADPTKNFATAKVKLNTTNDKMEAATSRYPLHPASLDAVYQLALIACHSGQMDRMRTAYVPVHISHMYIKNNNLEAWGTAIAHGALRGLRGAYAELQMMDQSGNILLDVEQLRCASYTDGPTTSAPTEDTFSAPLMRLTYRPDIRAMSNAQARAMFPAPEDNVARIYLFDKFERLGTLIVAEIYDRYANNADLANAPQHIQHFLGWVRRRMEDSNQWVEEARRLRSSERLKILEEIFDEVDSCSDVRICRHLFYNIDDVLYSRKTGLEVVVEDGRLHALYADGVILTGAYPQMQRCFDCLGHANPSLNILEIGAGTGGATRRILDTLSEDHGIKRYQSYTFTDITSGFLSTARESLVDYRDMQFSVLDIEQDPLENGWEPIYDVVVASECLHATSSIAQTLANCRKLLRPGGKLVLVENIRTVIGMGVVLGTLTGYWNGIPDGRVDSPFLDLEGWNSALIQSGFSGAELVLDDYPQPYTTACTIVATAIDEQQTAPVPALVSQKDVYILHCQECPPLLHQLAMEFSTQGVSSHFAHFDEVSLPPNSRVIVYLGNGESLISMDEHRLRQTQRMVRNTSSMVWITSCGVIQGKSPNAGVALGLLRTIGTENPTSRIQFLDLDPDCDLQDAALSRGIIKQEGLLQSRYTGESEDREFVWQQGCFWVSRLVPDSNIQDQYELASMPPSRTRQMAFGQHGPVRADFETPGILTSLYFRPHAELDAPLCDDCIEVKVAAVGLNWKDMAVSAGRFDLNAFSHEYSGVVAKVGAAVNHLSVGDRVYGFGHGHFGNYTRVPAAFARCLRDGDDFAQMASMPLVYMTAIYAFEHVTQVRRGEKVLVQSATGGLGLCAIQLALSMGAEIFCTVGTPDKAMYLTENMGIPASRIFSSRNPADIPRLMGATGGRGFDVILSTATGDMLHESVKTLAPLGRYIDVGRVDVQNSLTMGLDFFQRSTTFSSFDLDLVLVASPDMGRILMESLDTHYRNGDIGPIPSIITSDISRLDQVLLRFSKGTHVGKHVITFHEPDSLVRMVPPVSRAQFDPNAQYLVTGGWGGLGRSILHWMVSRGARYLTVLSRSGACSPEARCLIDDLGARGVMLQSMPCDITNPEQVSQAIEEVAATKPIRGIIHAAVAYEDLSFDKLSIRQWHSGLAAKVMGTRNLHEASLSLPLDFFVMTTSIESVLALATQSAYTAANTFQELFARYRHRQGLPASTVSFGYITDLGHLSKNTTTSNLMARNKVLGISEHEVLRILEPAFLNNETTLPHKGKEPWLGAAEDPLSAVTLVSCMDPRSLAAQEHEGALTEGARGNIPRWYTDSRVSLVMRAFADAERHRQRANDAQGNQAVNSTTGQLRQEFEEAIKAGPADRSKAESLVASAITKTVAEMLFVDVSGVDANRTVAEYGVDSLIAAELRNWFNVTFQAEISMLDLLDTSTSMKILAKMIVDSALGPQEA